MSSGGATAMQRYTLWDRIKRIWYSIKYHLYDKHQPSNLEIWAEKEIRRAGLLDKDSDYGGMIGKEMMRMVKQFCKGGHSGGRASKIIPMLQKLFSWEPIMPLTGEDSEWGTEASVQQNNRCSRVFKEKNEETGIIEAYDIRGRVFVSKENGSFTCRESRVPVTFPYTPKTVYIHEGTPEAEPFKKVFDE